MLTDMPLLRKAYMKKYAFPLRKGIFFQSIFFQSIKDPFKRKIKTGYCQEHDRAHTGTAPCFCCLYWHGGMGHTAMSFWCKKV